MVPAASAVWSWHCRGMQPLQALREFGAWLLSFSITIFATRETPLQERLLTGISEMAPGLL